MRHGTGFWIVLAVLTGVTGTAGAQIASRSLPPNLAPALFPGRVASLPPYESREIDAPVTRKQTVSQEADVKRATSLSDMPEPPRNAIRMAEAGQFKQAAAAGEALLKLPGSQYGDFTWDYLANATAWAYVQVGNPKAASRAHSAAAARIADLALAQYHRIAARALEETGKPAGQLKDYAVYQGEIRQAAADRIKGFENAVELAQKTRFATSRLRYLEQAYDELRVVTATDPEGGKQLAQTKFRAATDGLCTDVIPALLREAEEVRDGLVTSCDRLHFLPERQFGKWNSELKTLWNRVQHIKRLCRMHRYLKSIDLAGSDQSVRLFEQAHQLLFVPDSPGLVWQQLGKTHLINGIAQKDLRRRVPCTETNIRPMGDDVGLAEAGAVGWDKMGKMDGKMNGMDGDGFKNMDGDGFKEMDGNGFKKMDGNNFNKFGKFGKDGWDRPAR